MKKFSLSSFVFVAAFTALSAQADIESDHNWHRVLSCDGAHVDNRILPDRGQSEVQGQLVVEDEGVIRYFNQKQVIQSGVSGTSWVQEGGALPSSQISPGNLLHFGLIPTQIYAKSGDVSFDGNGLLVQLYGPGTQANWYFRNCVRQ